MARKICSMLVPVIAVMTLAACTPSTPQARRGSTSSSAPPPAPSVLRIAAEDAESDGGLVLRVRELVGPPPAGTQPMERPDGCEVRHVTEFVVPGRGSFVARGTRDAMAIALSGEFVQSTDGMWRGGLKYEETGYMHSVT